ncbi:MAG: acyl-CoA dehydratase activase [Nitrospinota bacterium]|nr:acyl-CoA dehydratase activase [Nitrospinota bacterium]
MNIDHNGDAWIGLDIGSVAVKGALLDSSNHIIRHVYMRSHGQPVSTTVKVMKDLLQAAEHMKIANIGVTGSAGELVSSLLDGTFTNEVVAHSHAVCELYPHIRTVVEMGGEDSKMLMFREKDGRVELEDFSMNNLCAAGTGSFLDQQANRVGVKIEGEFGQMAVQSKHPPRIAGRCSVFAKSDMIHLQQIGTSVNDIVAGLCYAVARTFKSNVGRGKEFLKPVAFFGGVASNVGVVKAMADELEIEPEDLFIPKESAVIGAIGAALAAKAGENNFKFAGLSGLENYSAVRNAASRNAMAVLTGEKNDDAYSIHTRNLDDTLKATPCYIGVDIGSLSTNVVAIDENMNVLARRYIRTASRPIQAVTRGLLEIGKEIGGKVDVLGVGTTGSGRYMVADFIGADAVRNEITAQATAAIHFHPDVDTIFEIGGQDSKYVSVENGAVVDFEMNKVCAAGTGSFIEEQAEKIDLNIEKEFANTAFAAKSPGKFGDRCTVFIESDLVSNQQKGMSKEDLAAGLAYSIVSNYLNRVVGDRKIGNKVLFQGGVAWNKAVVAAFEAITGKEISVPPHHDVTGAIGVAIIALKNHQRADNGAKSKFLGFDLTDRKYKISTFECKACDNVCDVSRVKFSDQSAHYYGARCELFEKDSKKKKKENTRPDLFAERERMIFGEHLQMKREIDRSKPVVGVPRSLVFYELFPFWKTFLEGIGAEVVLSGKTNQKVIAESLERVKGETCFPIKIMHGHVADLIDKKVEYIMLPSIISMNKKESKLKSSQMCPLVQATPYVIKSAIDLKEANVKLLEPSIFFQRGDKAVTKELEKEFGEKMGISARVVRKAAAAAKRAQEDFYAAIKKRGAEVIKETQQNGEKPVVLISRPYNGCDSGINMDLPRKLREMGKVAIPVDFLDLNEDFVAETYKDMYWRSGQRILAAADVVRRDPKLDAIFLSNFKCGPDSFIEHMLREALGGKPCLQLEVDEHSADAGAVTRLEAFFDSLENVDSVKFVLKTVSGPVNGHASGENGTNGKNGSGHHAPTVGTSRALVANKKNKRKMYVPYMCDHVYVLAAAIRASGLEAEVMPISDQESLDLGMRFSSGKECVPFTLTAGDMVKKIRSEGFDPEKSAFFMPTAAGPCRFGLYQRVHRMILDEQGYSNVPIYSPNGEMGYGDIGALSSDFTRVIWRGIVAVDILSKLLHETRPHEVQKGETDRVYAECLDKVSRIVETDSSQMYSYMHEVRDKFRAIRVAKTPRPVIGIVGEIYMRSHSFGNRDIIRKIEELGGQAWLAPIGEWMLYTTNRFVHNSMREKKYLDLFKGYMQDIFQRSDERKLHEPFKDTLVFGEDPAISEILKNASPYIKDTFEGEAILSVGKAVDYADKGMSGVVNIMPFSCMPGTVVAALSKKIREDMNDIPWLNLDYDGVEETNTQTRLEAFMYQAAQYKGKMVLSV